jgi:hypothetical protein
MKNTAKVRTPSRRMPAALPEHALGGDNGVIHTQELDWRDHT